MENELPELVPTSHLHGWKAYAIHVAGKRVGVVRQCFPTFERAPRGAMVVTKRWTARKPYWQYLVGDAFFPEHCSYITRKLAVQNLLRDVERGYIPPHAHTVSPPDTPKE